MKKYSYYFCESRFETGKNELGNWAGWVYYLYTATCKNPIIESDEVFDTETESDFAAIGHIDKLENGEV